MYISSRYILFIHFDDKYFRTKGVLCCVLPVFQKASTGRRCAGRKFRPVHLQPPDLAARGRPIAASLLPFSYLILFSNTHREKRQGRHGCATTKHRWLALTATLSQPHASPAPAPSPLAGWSTGRRPSSLTRSPPSPLPPTAVRAAPATLQRASPL